MRSRVPSASTAVCSTSAAATWATVNTPYGSASPGGAVTWKPGYDASASSIGGPAERSADRLLVGAAHHAVQQGAGLLLGGGVGVVGAGERPRRVEAGELLLHERRLGLDVEAR